MHDHGGRGTATAVAEGVRRIALVGSPNAGKTTLFNRLTGLHARTGNYPGVTITRSVGSATVDGIEVAVEDLPGTYSMQPLSPDEAVVRDVMLGRIGGIDRPDRVVIVVDATTMRRSLSLVAQVLALGTPAVVAVNMLDELDQRGGSLDLAALQQALGVPVHGMVAAKGQGLEAIRRALADPDAWAIPVVPPPMEDDEVEAWATSVLQACRYRAARPDTVTRRIDRVLLNPVSGLAVFAVVMFLFFQTIFTLAAPAQDAVEAAVGHLGSLAADHLHPDWLAGLVGDGIIGGVGAVLVFLPQIALLFLLISLLENVGYMSRAAYLMDRIMMTTGLDGRAFVSMLSAFACAIPAIMATRSISSTKIRMSTILSTPLMTCSARLPVYVLLTGMLFPNGATWGPFNAAGLTLFGLYLAGGLAATASARVLRTTAFRGERVPFYMEMPPYRLPSPRTVLREMWTAVMMFVRKASTIILGATLVLWVLLNFPTRSQQTAGMTDVQAQAYVMDHSFAAGIGHLLEPVFSPLGFNWMINVGILASLAAREVFVSTLGQVASATDPDNPMAALQATGAFTAPTIAAILVFFVFSLQCMSTIAVMRRETGTLKWPLIAFSYLFVLAWTMAFVAHTVVAALV